MYISIINQWGNVARKLLKNVKRKTICRLDDGAGGKNPVGGESPTRIMDLSNPYNHLLFILVHPPLTSDWMSLLKNLLVIINCIIIQNSL
jgi:hypothetical protein